MGQKTYTIELRVNFTDEGKHDVMREAARDAARTLLTTAMMLADKNKPQVALHSSDFFYGTEELALESADDTI